MFFLLLFWVFLSGNICFMVLWLFCMLFCDRKYFFCISTLIFQIYCDVLSFVVLNLTCANNWYSKYMPSILVFIFSSFLILILSPQSPIPLFVGCRSNVPWITSVYGTVILEQILSKVEQLFFLLHLIVSHTWCLFDFCYKQVTQCNSFRYMVTSCF